MEPADKNYGIFVSYSHQDELLISPIVQLLSVNRKDLVFQDKKDIQPGTKWRNELDKALEQAEAIIVFWCLHSSKSKEVEKEYSKAISQGKSVIPVLLDKTEVNDMLSAYQWIDFSNIPLHENMFDEHGNIIPKPIVVNEHKEVRISPWPMIIVLSSIFLLVLAMYYWGFLNVLLVVGLLVVGLIIFAYIRVNFQSREISKEHPTSHTSETGPKYRRVPPNMDLAFRILDRLEEKFPSPDNEQNFHPSIGT